MSGFGKTGLYAGACICLLAGCDSIANRPSPKNLLKLVSNPNRWVDEGAFLEEANRTIDLILGKKAVTLKWSGTRDSFEEIDQEFGLPFEKEPTPQSNLRNISKMLGQKEVLWWYASRKRFPANSLMRYFGSIPGDKARWDNFGTAQAGFGTLGWMHQENGATVFHFQIDSAGKVDNFNFSRDWLKAEDWKDFAWFHEKGTGMIWIRAVKREGDISILFQIAPRLNILTRWITPEEIQAARR